MNECLTLFWAHYTLSREGDDSGHCKLQAQFITSGGFGVVLKNESGISGRRPKSLLYKAKTPANPDSGSETATLGSRPTEGMQF